MLIRFLAFVLTLIEDATAQARRLFAYIKTTASRRAATLTAHPLVQQLRDEISLRGVDPRRFGNRATRRYYDSLYFRHRSKGRPIMRWDAEAGAFVPAPRRRVMYRDSESERLRAALRGMYLRRRRQLRRAMLRAVKQEARNRRLRLVALRAALSGVDALKQAAVGARFYDRQNERVLQMDENGHLRLVADGPLEAVVPTQIQGLRAA